MSINFLARPHPEVRLSRLALVLVVIAAFVAPAPTTRGTASELTSVLR